ncbi:hypothetical protein DTO195F2_5427 [Paecilomyces variotii]|nr:hypothetical protein DTO195F2_5427 [Paecilomyces variotii]
MAEIVPSYLNLPFIDKPQNRLFAVARFSNPSIKEEQLRTRVIVPWFWSRAFECRSLHPEGVPYTGGGTFIITIGKP